MEILPERIYEIECDLYNNMWDCDTAEDAQKFAYYNQGIRDMAIAIIKELRKGR